MCNQIQYKIPLCICRNFYGEEESDIDLITAINNWTSITDDASICNAVLEDYIKGVVFEEEEGEVSEDSDKESMTYQVKNIVEEVQVSDDIPLPKNSQHVFFCTNRPHSYFFLSKNLPCDICQKIRSLDNAIRYT